MIQVPTVQQRIRAIAGQQEAYRELYDRLVRVNYDEIRPVLQQLISWIEDHLTQNRTAVHNQKIILREQEDDDDEEDWGTRASPSSSASPVVRPDDPRVATYRLIATLYERALVVARTLATQPQQDAVLREQLADHQVTHLPYFGTLSLMDRIRLLEGTPTRQKGLALAHLPQYGQVSVNEQGWFLSIEGQELPMKAEDLHVLLVRASFAEPAPFTQLCVVPTLSWEAAYDGMTVVIPPETDVVYQTGKPGGETLLTTKPWRLSMHRDLYTALVWSVSYARYGQQETKRYGEVTQQCFQDAAHVPANQREVQYWQDRFWWANQGESSRRMAFQPGYPLSWLTREELLNFVSYQKAWDRHQDRQRQQQLYERTLEEHRCIQRQQFFQQGKEEKVVLPRPPSSVDQLFR